MTTVFVVGAGASREFDSGQNMPIGAALAIAIERLMVSELANQDGPVSRAFATRKELSPQHVAAMERIRDGIQSRDSIDDFLSEWDDIPQIGCVAKTAIAHILLEAERKTVLGDMLLGTRAPVDALRTLKQSWLGIIAARANPGARRRDINQVFDGISIVTFNYDRCIEEYLLAMFTHTAALTPEQASSLLVKIPIHHAYGSLGALTNPLNGVEFAANETKVLDASHGIITYTEEVETTRVSQIRKLVRSADKIIFLGCAYHPQNLELLFGDMTGSSALLWGTAYEMHDRPLSIAENSLKQRVRAVCLRKVTCAELLLTEGYDIFERDVS